MPAEPGSVEGPPTEATVTGLLRHLLTATPPASTDETVFLERQFDLGLAWVQFPVGSGGLGASRSLQAVVRRVLTQAGAPTQDQYLRNALGVGMIAPALVEHGHREQWNRWLRPLFTGAEIWCQLFSEPGAGSDIAALTTRAVREGGEWVVNGQKIWTTAAHRARRGLLLARTDPEAPRHRGLTAFVVDMGAPGVEVRPLRQIDGSAHLNEVFFTDLRVPDADRVGGEGEGWQVALTILMNERVSIGGGVADEGGGAIAEAIELWHRAAVRDDVMRDRLVRLWIQAESARLLNLRAARNHDTNVPGPEGSIAKLVYAQLKQQVYELCLDLKGPRGMLFGSYDMHHPEDHVPDDFEIQRKYLFARGDSIGGGSSEVMRNILGERVLGLPKEPRPAG